MLGGSCKVQGVELRVEGTDLIGVWYLKFTIYGLCNSVVVIESGFRI